MEDEFDESQLPTDEELDGTDGGDGGTSPQGRKLDEVTRQLAGVSQVTAQTNQQLAGLMSNPHIRAVLEAQGRGEEIVIMPKSKVPAEPSADEIELPANLDELPNSAVVGIVTKKLGGMVQSMLRDSLAPVVQKLESYDNYIAQNEQSGVRQQIETVKNKYPDFKDYSKQMVELNQQNPTLGAEELYLLAKAKSGGFTKNPASERPTNPGGRPSTSQRRGQPPLRGIAGFRSALRGALADADIDLSK